MKKYTAYYRVSTADQGRSGLGLEAQQETVKRYIEKMGGELLEEFTEIESGTKNDRPQLQRALNLARRRGSILIIAKLDRLSRNHLFISQLMESKVEFVACDIPEANTFTIHIFSALAQQERELISTRTKQALQAKKAQGIALGTPRNLSESAQAKGRRLGNEAKRRKAEEFAKLMLPVIQGYQEAGLSLRAIADRLNTTGELSASGKTGAWTATTVKNILCYNDLW